MSDGPHRSLPMRSAWKAFAEEASSRASPLSDVLPKLVRAIELDWRAEVSHQLMSKLRIVVNSAESGLPFPDSRAMELERMKIAYPGESLALVFIECVGRALDDGHVGSAAIEEGTRRVLDLRITRGFRQVEEHYYRGASRGEAQFVRDRLAQAGAAFDTSKQARVMSQQLPRRSSLRIRKRSGVDEGVPL